MVARITHYELNPGVLIVDDHDALLKMLSYHLRRNGFIVYTANHWDRAEMLLREKSVQLMIVRDNMRDDHFERARSLQWYKRAGSPVLPVVLLLSEKSPRLSTEEEAKDFALVFQLASDSLRDPGHLVRALIDTYHQSRPDQTRTVFEFEDLVLNCAIFQVTRAGKLIRLGPTEFKILQFLMENAGSILSRHSIMEYAWGVGSRVEVRTIDVHINRLRSALRMHPDEISMIETIRSRGYALRRRGHLQESDVLAATERKRAELAEKLRVFVPKEAVEA
jgi:two-component system phosphate regulon response regulator PhoB